MSTPNIEEVDIVLPQEGKEINVNPDKGEYENIFTGDSFDKEKDSVDSYDSLNGSFILIDEIRNDFSRMTNSQDIILLQKQLKILMPKFDFEITGVMDKNTEKALKQYDSLIGSM